MRYKEENVVQYKNLHTQTAIINLRHCGLSGKSKRHQISGKLLAQEKVRSDIRRHYE
jgi:hypothetical protein